MGERHFRQILAALLALLLTSAAVCFAQADEGEEDPFVTHKEEYEQQLISRANRIYAEEVEAFGSVADYMSYVNRSKFSYVNQLNNASIYAGWSNFYCDFTAAMVDVGLAVLGDVHGTAATVGTTAEIAVKELAKEICGEVIDNAWNELVETMNIEIPPMTRQEFIYSQAKLATDDVSFEDLWSIMERAENNGGSFPTGKDAMEFILAYQKNKSAFATMSMGTALYREEMNYAWYDWLGKIGESVAVSQLADKLLGTNQFVADHIVSNLSSVTVDYLTLVAAKFNDAKITEWANQLKAIELQTDMLLRYDWQEPIVYPPQHTVYLNANGGDLARDSITVYEGWTYDYIPTPDRFGYLFLGWFDALEGGSVVQASDTYTLTTDQILYAHWERVVISQGSCGPNLTYIHYGDGELIVSGYGEMTEAPWRYDNLYIARVSLPQGLTTICDSAFGGCVYLHEIDIPDSVTEIGYGAFNGAALDQGVAMPDALRTIGSYAFADTYLTELNLPQGVMSLGNNMLQVGSSAVARGAAGEETVVATPPHVTELVIPASVENMEYALRGSAVEKLTFESGRTEIPYRACYGAATLWDVTIPEGVAVINQEAFCECESLTAITLPISLEEIDSLAFAYTGLTALVLPENAKRLGYGIIYDTNVKEFTLPAGAESIDNSYTGGILTGSPVERLTIAPGATTVPYKLCYYATSLTQVSLPDSLESIDSLAFRGCEALTQITLPAGLKTIGSLAFAEAGLSELSLPEGVTRLDQEIIADTNITELIIPAGVESMRQALKGSAVKRIAFNAGRTVIPEEACKDATALEQVAIPDGVTVVDQEAFCSCESLTAVTLPDSLEEIHTWAFSRTGLMELALPEGVRALGYAIISDTNIEAFTLPAGAVNSGIVSLYPGGILTGSAVKRLTIAPGAAAVPDKLCQGVTTLVEVALPDSLERIGYNAFYGCAALTQIALPAGLKTIEDSAFMDAGLTDIVLPESLETMGRNVFAGTSVPTQFRLTRRALVFDSDTDDPQFLSALTVSATAQEDPDWTLEDGAIASMWEGIVSPSSMGATRITVRWAGQTAECAIVVRGEETLTLPASLHQIDEEAFAGIPAREIILPEGVNRIGSRAFADCAYLTLIYMSDSVTDIADDAFDNGVVFLCESDNAAAAFARAKGIPFAISGQ